jgi:hypothetical protein
MGSNYIRAITFLIIACLSNIMHNLLRPPMTCRLSKSKNHIQLLFVSSLTKAWHNGKKTPLHYSCYKQLQSTHLPCNSYKSECHQYLSVDDNIETTELRSKCLEYSPKYCFITIINLICDRARQFYLDLIPLELIEI